MQKQAKIAHVLSSTLQQTRSRDPRLLVVVRVYRLAHVKRVTRAHFTQRLFVRWHSKHQTLQDYVTHLQSRFLDSN